MDLEPMEGRSRIFGGVCSSVASMLDVGSSVHPWHRRASLPLAGAMGGEEMVVLSLSSGIYLY